MLPESVTENCDGVMFSDVKTMRNVHDFERVDAVARAYDAPILVKGFLANSSQLWNDIYATQMKTPLEYATMELKGFGNAFVRGSVMVGQEKGTLETLINKVNDGLSYFAAFVPFMTHETTQMILPGVDASQFMFDHNFISNFDQDAVSTPFHAAAAATSYAVQLTGSKLWLFSEPCDFEDYNVIHMPAAIPVNSSEKDFLQSGKPVLLVVQEPGDMLVFPPHWAHAVITKSGPTFMLNFRKLDFFRSLRIHFWGTVQIMLATFLFRVTNINHDFGGQKQKEGYTLTSPTNNVIEKEFASGGSSSHLQDSGCKDYFSSLLHDNDYR